MFRHNLNIAWNCKTCHFQQFLLGSCCKERFSRKFVLNSHSLQTVLMQLYIHVTPIHISKSSHNLVVKTSKIFLWPIWLSSARKGTAVHNTTNSKVAYSPVFSKAEKKEQAPIITDICSVQTCSYQDISILQTTIIETTLWVWKARESSLQTTIVTKDKECLTPAGDEVRWTKLYLNSNIFWQNVTGDIIHKLFTFYWPAFQFHDKDLAFDLSYVNLEHDTKRDCTLA